MKIKNNNGNNNDSELHKNDSLIDSAYKLDYLKAGSISAVGAKQSCEGCCATINKTIRLLIVCVPLGSKIWKQLVIFCQEAFTNPVSR